jgi:hypothetical protein
MASIRTSSGTASSSTFLRGDGQWQAAGGGAWNLIGTAVASGSASLTITGIDSTYDTYAIAISDMVPATDAKAIRLRLGDSSGVDSGASDYNYISVYHHQGSPNLTYHSLADETQILLDMSVGNAAGEGCGCEMKLHCPSDGTTQPLVTFQNGASNDGNNLVNELGVGRRNAVIAVDRLEISFNVGNIASGRLTVWGIAHA